MKPRHISLVLLSSLVLGSCSLLSKVSPRSGHEPAQVSADVEAESPRGTRTAVPAPPKTAGARPDRQTLCGGRWNIVSVNTTAIEGVDEVPYVQFEDASARFYAYDGCNYINGDYLLRSDGAMVFSNVLSTARYCPDNMWNAAIGSRLQDGSMLYVDTRRIGQDTYLYLRTAEDKVAMTLRRHNMEFLNGNWMVTAIEGRPVDDEECTLFFDINELKVHGNTGCNFFNGVIYISPDRSNALDLSDMATTMRACPNADRELRMMVALESTATAIEGKRDGTVLLLDAAGKEMMTLKRIPQ